MTVICSQCGEAIKIPDSRSANSCRCGGVTVYNTPEGVVVGHKAGVEYIVKEK